MIKSFLYATALFIVLLMGCTPSQKIVGSWINKEALPKTPYDSIFILAITQDEFSQLLVEDRLAKMFTARGKKVVKSNTIFPPSLMGSGAITREQMKSAIARTGCKALFTVALLDVRTVEKWVEGSSYSPMNSYGYYGNYYGYYNYRYPEVYTPGYHTIDNTYFVETNFYDFDTENLLWSVQSSAYNPKEIDSWFAGYSETLRLHLVREGLITQ